MAEPYSNISISSYGEPNGTRMRAGMLTEPTGPTSAELGSRSSWTTGVSCGACKMLRRRCVNGCVFAPYFSPEQGQALFAAVHYVFGASNVSKLLMQLPVHHRYNAVHTICYEAQARLADPVYGCVSAIIGLQKQVQALQSKIAMVQQQIINKRLAVPDTLQGSLQQPEPMNQPELHHCNRHKLLPVYQNGIYAEDNSILTMNMYDCVLPNPANAHQTAIYSDPNFDPLQLTRPFCKIEDGEEESRGLFMFDVQNDLN